MSGPEEPDQRHDHTRPIGSIAWVVRPYPLRSGRVRADHVDVEESPIPFAGGLFSRPPTIVVALDRDPLTGLLSRAALLEDIEARLTRGPVTAIHCDLDDFPSNGDDLLVEVAKLLTTLARSNDAIGRVGDEEFVIACDGLVRPHTTNLIARLGDALDVTLGVHISMGIAGSRTGDSASELVARADRAMHDNKRRINPRLLDGQPLR